MKNKSMIFVTFQKEGIHCYPDAATNPNLATGDWDDVSFLGSKHRHVFGFRVSIEIFHQDRDIEFIQFKRWLERLYSTDILDLDYKSCEMISDDLYNEIIKKYPGRKVSIEISEDGENGSYIEYDNDNKDTKVQIFEDKTSEGVRRVFYIDSDISDEEAKNIIDQFKTKNIPKVTPEESPESQPVSDEHFENTFNQAMKKLDEVVTPVQKEVLTKTSKWVSIKNHIQTLFGI